MLKKEIPTHCDVVGNCWSSAIPPRAGSAPQRTGDPRTSSRLFYPQASTELRFSTARVTRYENNPICRHLNRLPSFFRTRPSRFSPLPLYHESESETLC